MKKVLSVLLTICLFATMVIPAFAYGEPTDVAKVEFDKSEYKLEDIESMDLTELMTAYDAHGNRTNFGEDGDSYLQIEEWYSSYENILTVVGDQVQVNRRDVGTADVRVTLTAKTTTEKKASTTVIVPKEAVANNTDAIGFSTKNATLEVGGEIDKYEGLVEVLKGSNWTAAQAAGFRYAVKIPGTTSWETVPAAVDAGDGMTVAGIKFWTYDDGGLTRLYYQYTGENTDDEIVNKYNLPNKYQNYIMTAGESIRIRVLGTDGFPSTQKDKEFALNLIPVPGATQPSFKLPVSINMNVGEILDLTTLNSTLKDQIANWNVLPYGSYQTNKEAGQIAKMLVTNDDRFELKALAEGVVNLQLNVAGYATTYVKVNVGDGVANTPKMTASATVKVGEQVKLSIKELPAGATVKWAISNDNVNLGQWTGDYTNVYGKKAGTAVVTARIYNAETDGDLLYTLETTVTVEAADASTSTPAPSNPSTTAPTTNPQTGDSIFAGLFC